MKNPSRRNRNIGTAKSGHGKENDLCIPNRRTDLSVFWERLYNYVPVKKQVFGKEITFIVETPKQGHYHHCTIQDILRMLELIPYDDVWWIDLILLRQPTKKQSILSPVWGRLAYWSEIGEYVGTGIYLESQPGELRIKWSKSLNPDEQKELQRLSDFGCGVYPSKRVFEIQASPEAIRNIQLYQTIPHEIGHMVDRIEFCENQGADVESDRALDLYHSKPGNEKEVYANRYADDIRKKQKNNIPFAPMYNERIIREDGMKKEWFYTKSAG